MFVGATRRVQRRWMTATMVAVTAEALCLVEASPAVAAHHTVVDCNDNP
jgi:hypothetical protein